MIDAVIKYGAVSAKVHGMNGKRLTEADWARLRSCTAVRQVWDILRRSGAWYTVGSEPAAADDAAALIEALSGQISEDCKKLSCFLDKGDAESMRGFLSLRRSDRGMNAAEYRAWWKKVRRDSGLRKLVGADIDTLNLVYALRLRSFGTPPERAAELLIPVYDRLRPAFAAAILRARTDEEVLQLLRSSAWADTFVSLEPGAPERQYREYLAKECRNVLSCGRPGMAMVQAFLTAKDLERQRLSRLVGAVGRGIDPAAVV